MLFDQSYKSAQEFREKIRDEYESKGKEYDSQHMRNFHKVFDEIYPGYFHNSFIVSTCSLFEHQVKELWGFIQEDHKVPFAWDDFRDTVPVRFHKLLNFAGVVLQDDPPRIELSPPDFKPQAVYPEDRFVISATWKELVFYYRVRNCIVHNNYQIEKARGSSTLNKYVVENGIIAERKGHPEIQLNEGFNVKVCNTMGKFCDKLMSAYYSTPLPKEAE